MPGDKKLFSSDLRWNIPFQEMLELFNTVYHSGKRLPQRAYQNDKGELWLPYFANQGGDVFAPHSLVEIISRHIELALQRSYADAIFFSDMGHAHFLIPEEKYKREYADIPVSQMARLYEKIFSDQDILFVYHTAEQLATDETSGEHARHLRWRYFTRNLIGQNRKEGEVYVLPAVTEPGNTLRDLVGYRWWSSGFNVSASAQGCFTFTHAGEQRRYDISLFDLESESVNYGKGARIRR